MSAYSLVVVRRESLRLPTLFADRNLFWLKLLGASVRHGRDGNHGCITPEIAGKLPGYLLAFVGLESADIPNGLATISEVLAAGWRRSLPTVPSVKSCDKAEALPCGGPGEDPDGLDVGLRGVLKGH